MASEPEPPLSNNDIEADLTVDSVRKCYPVKGLADHPQDLDHDSAYTSDKSVERQSTAQLLILFSESYTTSLKSSIFNYKEEYGRRYHAFREGRKEAGSV